jgi:N-acetylglucosaminyldiphosphoundecaprenol N-acetyl-beta-D-mannosaminyltransferase
MIKTIDVAGISLDNYTVREAIMNVEKGMSDHGFHTIEEVNMDTLMMAETDEVIRAALDSVEHTVIAEAEILDAVGAATYQRKREIEHRDFFYEMMKRIERNHKTLFLIGDGAEQTRQMCERLGELYPRCEIVGSEALEECGGATDDVVNEMNSLAPDVILSILPSPKQEHFLMENRDRLSAGLWYGVGAVSLGKEKSRIGDALRNLIRKHKLEKQVHLYNDSNA